MLNKTKRKQPRKQRKPSAAKMPTMFEPPPPGLLDPTSPHFDIDVAWQWDWLQSSRLYQEFWQCVRVQQERLQKIIDDKSLNEGARLLRRDRVMRECGPAVTAAWNRLMAELDTRRTCGAD